MKSRQAPQTHATLSATGLSAILLLGVCCATALASTDNTAPCLDCDTYSDNYDDTSLREILENDAISSPAIRAVDSSDSVTAAPLANSTAKTSVTEAEKIADTENSPDRTAPVAEITTRLPGVPESDVPRFRRQMFRTDI